MFEVWKITNATETVTTFKWWQKKDALKFASRIFHSGIRVIVFENDIVIKELV